MVCWTGERLVETGIATLSPSCSSIRPYCWLARNLADELQGINKQLCDDSEWMSLKPEYRGKLIAFAGAGNGDYYAFDYR